MSGNNTYLIGLFSFKFLSCSIRKIMPLCVVLTGSQAMAQASDAAADQLHVYGNMTTIELAPVHVAIDQNLYVGQISLANGGVRNLHGQATTSALYEAGTADVATNAETQALRYSINHPDVRIIMTLSEGLYRIIAKKSSGITTLADLKGKKVGTTLNTSSNYFLHKMLTTAGLGIDEVEVTSVPTANYATALTTMGLDAITIWEPWAQYAEDATGDDVIEFSGKGIYREIFNLNTTAANLVDPEMRGKIVDFVRALIKASALVRANPAIAYPLVAASANLPETVVESVFEQHAYPGNLAPDLLDVMVEEDGWVARETNRAPRTREQLASLIDSSVLEEAMAGD